MDKQYRQNRKARYQNKKICTTTLISKEQGFSYIEIISYFFLLGIFIPTFLFLSQMIGINIKKEMEKERLQMEWMAFVPQLERDVREGVRFYRQDDALIIDLPSEKSVRYELKKRQIIRSVKNQGDSHFRGNMLVLQDVYYAVFLPETEGVFVDIGLQGWYTHLDFLLFLSKRG